MAIITIAAEAPSGVDVAVDVPCAADVVAQAAGFVADVPHATTAAQAADLAADMPCVTDAAADISPVLTGSAKPKKLYV